MIKIWNNFSWCKFHQPPSTHILELATLNSERWTYALWSCQLSCKTAGLHKLSFGKWMHKKSIGFSTHKLLWKCKFNAQEIANICNALKNSHYASETLCNFHVPMDCTQFQRLCQCCQLNLSRIACYTLQFRLIINYLTIETKALVCISSFFFFALLEGYQYNKRLLEKTQRLEKQNTLGIRVVHFREFRIQRQKTVKMCHSNCHLWITHLMARNFISQKINLVNVLLSTVLIIITK